MVHAIPPNLRYFNRHEFLRQSFDINQTIFKDMKVFLCIFKVTGLLPMYERISHYSIGPPNKTKTIYMYFARSLLILFLMFILFIVYRLFEVNLLSFIPRNSDVASVRIKFSLLFANFFTIIFTLSTKSTISLKIINDILDVDKEISYYCGADINLSNDCRFITTKIFCGLCLLKMYIFLLSAYGFTREDFEFSYFLIIEFVVLVAVITVMLYISALLRIITVRYAFVNNVLNGYSYGQQQRLIERRAKVCRRRMNELVLMENFPEDSLFAFRLHNKLLQIQRIINNFCNPILIVFMELAFYLITASVYAVFVDATKGENISFTELQQCVANTIIFTTLLAIVCRVCGQVSGEANKISQVVARIYSNTKEHRYIVDKFLTNTIKQRIEFTAYGFFAINNSTFFKIFTAATTYLVVLIQFKQLEDSKLEYKN